MYQLEDKLWWYRGMRRITGALFKHNLPSGQPLSILDVGAGSGGSLALLRPLGQVTAFDYSPLAVGFYKTRDSGRVAQASAAAIPFRDASFDLVTIFDVLATLDDEAEHAALHEIARVMRPGAHLFWREPAFMFLYGPHDRATHVYRRYSSRAFRDRLSSIGLTAVRLSYANSFLFPVAVVRRLLAKRLDDNGPPRSDVREMPEPLNSVLAQVLGLEAPLIVRGGLPIGLSVLTLARKE